MYLDDVRRMCCPTRIHDETVGVVFIRLVNYHEVVLHHHLVNNRLVIEVACGVIGIAEPEHAVLRVCSWKQLTGIFILAERRTWNVGLHGESLCNEIDSICSAIGDDDLFGC